MGGFVALSYATRFPAQCARLCLIAVSPTGKASKMAWPTLRTLGPIRLLRMIGRGLWYGKWWSWRKETMSRKQARYAPMAVLQEGKPEFRSEIRARGERFLVDNDNAPALERLGFSTDLTPDLGQLTMPVRVIVGSKDAGFVAGAELLRRSVRQADVSVLAGVGHEPLVEARDDTLEMIRAFLKQR
jgi:pimeloyl-ACP methyl ester carboxylesterase